MRALAFAALITLATQAAGQDRQGNDTPGEWRVVHQQAFGLWDSVCDTRTTGTLTEDRCYIRYVEVYEPRPNFGALFLFVTADQVEFGIERGTRFGDIGPYIEGANGIVWSEDRRSCRRGGDCVLGPAQASAFLDATTNGHSLRMVFDDRDGAARDLRWDLAPFSGALADWRAQSRDRGLPHL